MDYKNRQCFEMEESSKRIKSNCLIQASVRWIKSFPNGRIGYDNVSPNGTISFYCNVDQKQYRFRRDKSIKNNKGKFLFIGKVVVVNLQQIKEQNVL